jgi:NDP-sugar pyrophosphorylase family protein
MIAESAGSFRRRQTRHLVSNPLEIPVAILAGGLATRLRPVTEIIPRSPAPVAGKPFLAGQLERLHSRGIRRAVLCVGYLGEMIRRDFGNEAFGVKLDYSIDGPKLPGSGGAVLRALPMLGPEFFVLHGDSCLPIEFRPVADFFHRSGKLGCLTVYPNDGRHDAGNAVFAENEIKVYDRKNHVPAMGHIDCGLSVFKAAAFEGFPADEPLDLADVMGVLVRERQLAGFEVRERLDEIGSPGGLSELERLLAAKG